MCLDTRPLIAAPVAIRCFSLNQAPLTVTPPTVAPGATYVVTNPSGGALPAQIDCEIAGAGTEGTLQRNLIDVSGNVPLHLGNKFGSMLLERCDALSCKDTFRYTTTAINVGPVPMVVDGLDFTFNNVTGSLLSQLQPNPVPVAASASVITAVEVDLCDGRRNCASAVVTADPPNGNMCQDTTELCVQYPLLPPVVNPPPPNPTVTPPVPTPPSPTVPLSCPIEIATRCVIAGTGENAGQDCSTPINFAEPCLSRPTEAIMLFNGGSCAQSQNIQNALFNCTDVGTVPTADGAQVHILVTDIKGQGIVYFDGLVGVGDFFPLRDGTERFEADQFITISTPDKSAILQLVRYHSSCSQNLELNNKFGSLQLVSFFNDVQGNVTSFNVLEFSLSIDVPISVSGERVQLTRLVADTNFAGSIDLTSQVTGQTASNTGTVAVTLSGTIDTSERREYVIRFDIAGVRASDGAICSGMTTLTFQAGNLPGPPPPPTIGPPPSAMGSMGTGAGELPTSMGGSMSSMGTNVGELPGGGSQINQGTTGSMGGTGGTGSMGSTGTTGSVTGTTGGGTTTTGSMSSGGSMSNMATESTGTMRRRRRLFAW
jgi:hypothetical protein